jgi:hypothetical protein
MAWNELDGLFGAWVAEQTSGGIGPQQAMGEFSFKPQLGGVIVIRESIADYPASSGKAAYRHEDLMVIFSQERGMRAVYWDSECHHIEYKVHMRPQDHEIEFLSEPDPRAPAFRLTYRILGSDRMHGKFEIQPPGATTYSVYLEWDATRKRE